MFIECVSFFIGRHPGACLGVANRFGSEQAILRGRYYVQIKVYYS